MRWGILSRRGASCSNWSNRRLSPWGSRGNDGRLGRGSKHGIIEYMALQRHKKFERSKEPPVNLRIQPRDLELLRDVSDYRFLDTGQILALHQGGKRQIRLRLASLYHLGYLERPASQKLFSKGGSFLIYSITEKGAELISRKEFGKRNAQVSFPYLSHAMMISRFRATLTIALRSYPTKPKIERWEQGYDLKDILRSRGQSPELVPDAFFTIRDEKGALDFFLEADQSTMKHELMLNKMKTYWKWFKEKQIQKKLNIENFRVLTITKSEERADNLRRLAKNADYNKTGSNMFLFLSETQYLLEKPETILSPIWTSAKDEKHQLLG